MANLQDTNDRLAQPEFDSALQSAAMTQTAPKLAQPAQSPLDRMAENARELGLDYEPEQEPVAHSIVAGALFDFMGWLTTRRERLVLSSTDDAAPAADAIKDFANMRGLLINGAQVQEWQEHLTTPPNCPNCASLEAQNTELDAKLAETEQEPVAWQWLDTGTFRKSLPSSAEPGAWNPLYTTPPHREWQGMPPNDLEELIGFHSSTDGYMSEADAKEFARDLEERLKLRNS